MIVTVGGGGIGPTDLARPINVEFNSTLAPAIRDIDHAGLAWSTSDGGGAGSIAWFREFAPGLGSPLPPVPTIQRLTVARTVPAYTRAAIDVELKGSRVMERQYASLERLRNGRWVLERNLLLTGPGPRVWVQVGAQGTVRYRLRVNGRATKAVTVRVTAARRRGIRICRDPLQSESAAAAVVRQSRLSVLCRVGDGRVTLRRVDLARRVVLPGVTRVGEDMPDGTSVIGSVADDGSNVWVLRGASLLPVNWRTGAAGVPIRLALSPGTQRFVAAGTGRVVVLDGSSGVLYFIDGRTRAVTARVLLPLDNGSSYFSSPVVVGSRGVWIRRHLASGTQEHLLVTAQGVIARRGADGPLIGGLLGVWEKTTNGVRRIDPAPEMSLDLGTLRLDDVVVGADALWGRRLLRRFTASPTLMISRIDPKTGRRIGQPRPHPGDGTLLAGPGGPWVLSEDRIVRVR